MLKLPSIIRFVAGLVLVVLLAAPGTSEAQVKPFKVEGKGNAPEGLSVIGGVSPYTMSGKATLLGKYSGFGIAQVTGEGTFTGGFVFVAANGDKLVCEHPGTFAVYPDGAGKLYAIFDAIFTPASLTIDGTLYESTGRFANASGSFRMIATTKSFTILETGSTTPFDLSWQGLGILNFPNK